MPDFLDHILWGIGGMAIGAASLLLREWWRGRRHD